MFSFIAVWFLLHLCTWTLADFTKKDKIYHRSPEEKQEYLINSLAEFDITYPTEMDYRGRITDHVTTLSSRKRRRRSVNEDAEPILYQVQFKGQTIKMVLRVNMELFGSNFTIERHREDGSIETKTVTEQCYLVGETESLHTSVAISDCDGLAGIIDLGNDTIYIEPVLNTSTIVHRGWTRPGRPHLIYRKAVLDRKEEHNLEFDEFISDGFPTGLNVEEGMIDPAAARSETSYITIVNSAGRAVKVYYVTAGVENLFQILEDRAAQNVDTFTLHGWLAKDYDTGERLYIDRKRTFYPPKGTTMRNRHRVYITVPPDLKLPVATKPSQPNSHLTFINRSNRFVKLYYIEKKETMFFYNLPPGENVLVHTYTSHKWFAKDLDTGKILHVNGHKEYSPEETELDHPIRVFVTVPSS